MRYKSISIFLKTQTLSPVCLAVGIVLLSGCAVSNEGAIDFRRAEFITKEHLNKAREGGKDPLAATKLFRKDLLASDPNAIIQKLDKVSIRLRAGFLEDCNEWHNPFAFDRDRFLKKNCEIAILFKAVELGNGADFNFKPGAEREARLVYFSSDVQPGQHFNFHNMPVYGPIDYKGRPLGIDITITEIDAEDKQAFAIFKTIAGFGAKAYAPAAPALSILEGIGKSLLASGTDDTEWRFSMVLDPAGGYDGSVYSTAEAGDFVFVRERTRQAQTPWDKLQLDHNTGRLWIKPDQGELQPFTKSTYLSVQIVKGAGSENVILEQNTYGPFRDALDKETNTKVEEFVKNVGEPLEAIGRARVRSRNFNQAQKLFEGILADQKEDDNSGAANRAFELCRSITDAAKRLSVPKTKDLAGLDLEQVEYLLSRIRTKAGLIDLAIIEQFAADNVAMVSSTDCMKVALQKRAAPTGSKTTSKQ